MSTDAPPQLSPQQFIDRSPMSRKQWLIVTLGLFTMVAEGLDSVVASFVYPRIVKEWGTDLHTVTVTVTVSVLAMVAGGVAAGPLADRHGRKGITVAGIAVFGLATAGMGAAQNIATFAGLRILACLALGAVLPTVMALVADWTPAGRRVQMVALAFAGVTVGTTTGGILSSVLIPAFGWPVLMAVCGLLPLLLIPAIVRHIPESVSVLAARRRPAELRQALATVVADPDGADVALEQPPVVRRPRPPARVILSRDFAPTTALLWLCSFVAVGAVFLVLSYLPLLGERMGLTSAQAGVAVAVFGWGGLVGQFAVSFALKRFDLFRALAGLCALSAAVLAGAALWATQFTGVLATAFALGLCLPAANSAIQAIGAIVYPPSARATGMSWATSVGKLGPVAAGLFGGLMVEAGWSLGTVLATVSVPVGLLAAAAVALRTRSRTRTEPKPQTVSRPVPTLAPEKV
ncbi:MFS transporter [Streptomyces justiciae]|uniref:MFS transporter n=1 Tax=Streptomyces justiciae TaxID=2780140 RepID=UPI0021180800|nr:MFS transporter [Streptomyces justiciae]MCW8384170.1 MFS transporter [Streptomyces justiciae]